MRKFIKISLIILLFVAVPSVLAFASQAIAVWAYPDSNTVSGTIHIGVVAYHETGINRVVFSINAGEKHIVTKETINPETNEYEYVFIVDTTQLADDTSHTINVVAYPNSGQSNRLPDYIIQVDNTPNYKTWYVDISGDDTKGDGSPERPFRTIGRALGTEWAVPEPHAHSGDTVKVRAGTYGLPQGMYANFTKYVTIMPDGGAKVIIDGGGVLRSSFLKFQGFDLINGGVSAYTHHIWFKDCTYTGRGQIWPDTGNIDEAFRSRNIDNPGHAILENFTVHDANQGLSVIAQGNSIIRNCHIYNQNGDAMKFQGENILITGNVAHHIRRTNAWSVSKKGGPYDFGSGSDLILHRSDDYGNTWDTVGITTVTLSGSGLYPEDVVRLLNGNNDFTNAGFVAVISEPPYPYQGNVQIFRTPNREQYQFYIDGPAQAVLNFSDNTRMLNDISKEFPAKNSTDHNDFLANDDRDAKNVIIRNNRVYAISSQGMKFDGIARDGSGELHFYKENIAIVNNQITGSDDSARHLYFSYRGSSTRSDGERSYLHYHNFLIAHNTIFRSEDVLVRAVFTIDMSNPDIKDFIIKDNIIGEYSDGDWKLAQEGKGISDFNLFYPSKHTQAGVELNNHSVKGEPSFVNPQEWNFELNSNSKAIGIADPSYGIMYDILWRIRSSNPEAGAYEFDPVSAPPGEENGPEELKDKTEFKCYNNVFNPTKGERALIWVELQNRAHVKIGLYNSKGNKIRELADKEEIPGKHKYYWDGKNDSGNVVGSGLYFVHIEAGDYKKTKKIAVVK